MEILIGRQPLFDARLRVHAYELLFRYGERFELGRVGPAVATASVLTEALTAFGLDALVGSTLASINVPREFLLSHQPLPVAPARVMIEVPVSAGGDDELVDAIRAWQSRGFQVAIDDVRYDDPELERLFDTADMLKVDCLGRRPDELKHETAKLRRHRKPLLAEKLESRRELEECRGLGFEFFQGYFLARPGAIKGRAMIPQRGGLVRLVVELQDPACDVDRVEAIVQQDPALSYRLLRCVNSAAYGLPRAVESLREAIVYLGTATIRHLTCLLLLSTTSDQPRELLRMAMFRARFCEAYAGACGIPDRSRFFTVGLLSLFGALLEEPLEKLVEDLPIAAQLKAALVRHEGDTGRVLAGVEALERGDWAPILACGQPPDVVQRAWMDAVRWVEEIEGLVGKT